MANDAYEPCFYFQVASENPERAEANIAGGGHRDRGRRGFVPHARPDRIGRGRELQRRLAWDAVAHQREGVSGLWIADDHHPVQRAVQGSDRLCPDAHPGRDTWGRNLQVVGRHGVHVGGDLLGRDQAAGREMGLPLYGVERQRGRRPLGVVDGGLAKPRRDHETATETHAQACAEAGAKADGTTHDEAGRPVEAETHSDQIDRAGGAVEPVG
jgi:hypothetical protein